jgi:hypothetical protein
MRTDVTYPIYLVKKGSVDIERLFDFRQLEEWVVPHDAINDQYLVWDYYGRPLTVDSKLDCKLRSAIPDGSLKDLFEEIGEQYELSFGELNDEVDLELAFQKLKITQKAAIKAYKAKNKSKIFPSLD